MSGRDFYRLSADLGQKAITAPALARKVLTKTAADIQRDAKINAPVDTGNLRNSISQETDRGGLRTEVGPTANYGLYVETGTSRMGPQPYLGPAVDRHTDGFYEAMARIADLPD